MKRFLDWFNKQDSSDLVVKAGIAHLWFVTIHPFHDGNGRIARAIADMVLARSEQSAQRFYSMSAQIRQERRLTMTFSKRPRRARSISRIGLDGFWIASAARLRMRRVLWRTF